MTKPKQSKILKFSCFFPIGSSPTSPLPQKSVKFYRLKKFEGFENLEKFFAVIYNLCTLGTIGFRVGKIEQHYTQQIVDDSSFCLWLKRTLNATNLSQVPLNLIAQHFDCFETFGISLENYRNFTVENLTAIQIWVRF